MGGAGGGGGAGGTGSAITDPGTEGDGRFELSPPYDPVNMEARNGPHGTVYDLSMRSEDSSIYPGLNGSYSRKVQVYVPEQYLDGTPAPFMVVQDGPSHTSKVQRALDNLIADGGAPALIAILVDNGGGDSVGSERGLEYDTLSDTYARFVDTEVLPTVSSDPNIAGDYPGLAFTDDPEGRAAMGCSSGAAAAFTMAWFGNDSYRRVLSYSGTFVDQQDPAVPTYPNGAWEYHEHLIDDAPMKPLRVYLHVGERDLGYDASAEGLHNWVLANEGMFAALSQKGYHVHFDFALATGHCDGSVIDHTLYDALKWLWRGYPAQ
jgi:enterochelin esterase-like enzyme